jgi:hypothetical protein
MSGLLSVLLSYPTVVFTGLLGLVLLYWLFVILGALDIDLFHADADGALEGLDGVDGAAKGAIEGAAKGAMEMAGAAKGAFEAAGKAGGEAAADAVGAAFKGGAEGALDAADGMDGVAEAKGEAAAGLLHALNLRRAPVTVTFSFIVLIGWILSYFGVTYLSSSLGAVLPTWLFSTIVLLASFGLSLPLTSLVTKPMEGVFQAHSGKRRIDFVGSEVRIRTGSVDGEYGQAELDDGKAGLIIQVRNDTGTLKRGDRALIIDFDREQEAYIVEAYDAMLEDDAAAKARRS